MTAPADPELMRRALRLAEHGWGRVHPNPLVGAIVVAADGRVIAEAWHQEFGGAQPNAPGEYRPALSIGKSNRTLSKD